MSESKTLEYKETVTNTFLKTVSAYANGRLVSQQNEYAGKGGEFNMKRLAVWILAIALVFGIAGAAAAEEENLPVFSWKGYQMTVPVASADAAAFGLTDLQGVIVIVEIKPVEGTIAFSDFHQELFSLIEPDGTEQECSMFMIPNMNKLPVSNASVPNAQQDYIRLCFGIGGLTAETLTEAKLAVREEKDAEPQLVSLENVPAQLPEAE